MPFLPSGEFISMGNLHEIEKIEETHLREWERNRVIKKCRECGQAYSYSRGETDPKECQRCRGEEGELIF